MTDLMTLDAMAVGLSDGSRTLGQGLSANSHPLDAVARLARELAAFAQRLKAADLVITGGVD
jgi:2-keto-4-pentenoate hydratase